MFQNYTADNILTLDGVISGSDSYTANISAVTHTNATNRSLNWPTANGIGVTIAYDGNQDNVLLTIQAALSSSAGNDYVGYVHTYAASTAITGTDTALPTNNATFVPILSANGSALMECKVLVPKLQLEAGEQQYILIAITSPTARDVRMVCNAKLHLEDYRVFQPSK